MIESVLQTYLLLHTPITFLFLPPSWSHSFFPQNIPESHIFRNDTLSPSFWLSLRVITFTGSCLKLHGLRKKRYTSWVFTLGVCMIFVLQSSKVQLHCLPLSYEQSLSYVGFKVLSLRQDSENCGLAAFKFPQRLKRKLVHEGTQQLTGRIFVNF